MGGAENLSMNHAAQATPIDCPKKRKHEKSDTAVPRALGAICVAWVCKVLCKA